MHRKKLRGESGEKNYHVAKEMYEVILMILCPLLFFLHVKEGAHLYSSNVPSQTVFTNSTVFRHILW